MSIVRLVPSSEDETAAPPESICLLEMPAASEDLLRGTLEGRDQHVDTKLLR
jgi:hypothetical protein